MLVVLSRLDNLVNAIIKMLFENEYNRLNKQIISLVRENTSLGGSPDGFRFGHRFFSDLDLRLRAKVEKRSPVPSLVPAIQAFIDEEKLIEFEKQRIHQALVLVLKDCKTYQDIRDALPNCLVHHIDVVKNLARTREEAFTLQNDPRAYNQYMKIKDKIDFYCVGKLLY